MARVTTIKALRTTRANLNSQAASSGLIAGELYAITDEGGKLALGLTSSTYSAMQKEKGTTTNDNPGSGIVGEYLSDALATPVSLVSGVAKTVLGLSLTAGDWDVRGVGCFQAASTTLITGHAVGISLTSDSMPSSASGQVAAVPAPTNGAEAFVEDAAIPTPTVRISLASSATVYLVARGTFSTSTYKAYGSLAARRMR